jgi:hypothetical protein
MAQSLFEFNSYIKYLAKIIKTDKTRGIIGTWAEAAGCQRSYLSNVLAGRATLNLDQGFRLAEHLRLSNRGTRVFSRAH